MVSLGPDGVIREPAAPPTTGAIDDMGPALTRPLRMRPRPPSCRCIIHQAVHYQPEYLHSIVALRRIIYSFDIRYCPLPLVSHYWRGHPVRSRLARTPIQVDTDRHYRVVASSPLTGVDHGSAVFQIQYRHLRAGILSPRTSGIGPCICSQAPPQAIQMHSTAHRIS